MERFEEDYSSLTDFLSEDFLKFFYTEQEEASLTPTATVLLNSCTAGVVNASDGPSSSATTASEHSSNEIWRLLEKNNDVNT